MTLREEDLKIESFRPRHTLGGQHVGLPPTGIRVTHLPTGIFAVCDEERSMWRNKREALRRLELAVDKHLLGVPEIEKSE